MDDFMTSGLIAIGIIVLIGALIGALILQWLHKWGFKIAKVETSQIPGFSKRFLIQFAAMLVGYGVIHLVGILFDVGVSDADALALVSNITTTM